MLEYHPIEIYLAADELFGDEPWLQWEPETLRLELKAEVSGPAVDKLLAVQAVGANSNEVCSNSLAFEKVCNAFCNNVCVMDAHQPLYVEELCYAVPQIDAIIRKVHGKPAVFIDEIPGYVAATAKYRGWIALPGCLGFAQNMLLEINHMTDKSARYVQYRDFINEVKDLFAKLDKPSAESILNDPQFENIPDDLKLQLSKIVGAVLFDPTLAADGDA